MRSIHRDQVLQDLSRTVQDHRFSVRVRYHEVDGQGRVHHAQYLNYFERGRVEMLRAAGHSYKELESAGYMLVVRRMEIEYVFPAEFDDELTLVTTVLYARGARIEHDYQLFRHSDQQLIVTAQSEIACVDRSGSVRRLPHFLQSPRREGSSKKEGDDR